MYAEFFWKNQECEKRDKIYESFVEKQKALLMQCQHGQSICMFINTSTPLHHLLSQPHPTPYTHVTCILTTAPKLEKN